MPAPIATRQAGRVVSVTRSATATLIPPTSKASSGYNPGSILGVIPKAASSRPARKVIPETMVTPRTMARHGRGSC